MYQVDKKESIHLQSFAPLEDVWSQLTKQVVEPLPGMDIPEFRIGAREAVEALDRFTFNAQHAHRWNMLTSMRSAILKAIEVLREQGIVKHSLEAQVAIFVEPEAEWVKDWQSLVDGLKAKDETAEQFFKEFVIVSQFTILQEPGVLEESSYPGLHVKIEKADGQKCPRCWQWEVTEHEHGLCSRCAEIVGYRG